MAKSKTGSPADASAKSVGDAALVKFNFHGDELDVATTPDGEHWVVLARLCDPLGVDVNNQRKKLLSLPWACTVIITAHDASGRNQELFCVNLRSVAGWLFTLNAGKVRPEVREKLIRYQRECAEALADHFLGKRGALPEGAMSKEDVQRMAMRYASKMSFLEAEKRRVQAELTDVKAELDKALDASSALIAARDVERLKKETDHVARLMLQLGRCKKPNLRSALLTVRNRVMSRWLGAGKTIEGMPREYVAECLAALRVMRRDYEEEIRRRGNPAQTTFFSLLDSFQGSRPN